MTYVGIIDDAAVRQLVMLLVPQSAPESPHAAANAAAALTAIAKSSRESAKYVIRLGGVPLIIRLLTPGSAVDCNFASDHAVECLTALGDLGVCTCSVPLANVAEPVHL